MYNFTPQFIQSEQTMQARDLIDIPDYVQLNSDALRIVFSHIPNIKDVFKLRMVSILFKQVVDNIVIQPHVALELLSSCKTQSQLEKFCSYLSKIENFNLHRERTKLAYLLPEQLVYFFMSYYNVKSNKCHYQTKLNHAKNISNNDFAAIKNDFEFILRVSTSDFTIIMRIFTLLPPKLMISYLNTLAEWKNQTRNECFMTNEPSLQYLVHALCVTDVKLLDPLLLRKSIDLVKQQYQGCYATQQCITGLEITLAVITPDLRANSFIPPAHVYVNLNGANLENYELCRTDLRYCFLAKANLKNTRLNNTLLTGVDLSGAILSQSSLIEAELSDAQLRNTICLDTIFKSAALHSANFHYSDLTCTTFKFADLANSTFISAKLHGVNFNDANLTGCDLFGSVLTNTTINHAIFKNINWHIHILFSFLEANTHPEIVHAIQYHRNKDIILESITQAAIKHTEDLAITKPQHAINFLRKAIDCTLFQANVIATAANSICCLFGSYVYTTPYQNKFLDQIRKIELGLITNNQLTVSKACK